MQDYNVVVTDDRHQDTVRFWRQRLATVNGGFRWEACETASSQDSNATYAFSLSKRASDVLDRFANDPLGRFAINTTAIAYVLSRYFHQSPIILKSPALALATSSNATFPVPIIINVQEDKTIREYLRESSQILGATYSFDGFPLTAFLERDYSLNTDRMTNVAVCDARLHGPTQLIGEEDILIQFNQGGADTAQIIYKPDRVESYLVSGFARHFVRTLEQFENVQSRLADIELLDGGEKHQLTVAFNSTAASRASETVVSLFESQVKRAPAAVALIHNDRVLTYEDLNAQANRLARHLINGFDSGNRVVGVMATRSPEAIVAILGALKAGSAYVPIDPEYPMDRIGYILGDAGISILLTESDYIWELQDFDCQMFALDLQLGGLTTSDEDLDQKPDPQDTAYVIYTSGSTGNPKGCQVEHRNLSNYLLWATSYYFKDEATGNFGLYSSLSFDFTITNVFCPLLRGKSLFIYDQSQEVHRILEQAFGPQSLIDTMKLTPSHIRLLEEFSFTSTNIKKVIAGGEELRASHIQTLRRINPEIEIYNEYGPTEATVGCIIKRIEPDETEILIGKPIENTRVYILDKHNRLVPVGVRGEICLAGEGVARGYNRRPDLTEERFIVNPFEANGRLYKTGDIGRWLPDGNIQCFGRNDDQVKIRGNRIELGEIENLLAQHSEVRQAVVIAREDHPGEKRLVAYLVGSSSLTASSLREFILSKLPPYMMPASFVFLESLPLTTNGKVDKKALPAPESLEGSMDDFSAAPTTVFEEELLRIWQEVLHRERIRIDDNFFEIGGDSLSAVQVISRVWERLGVEIHIDDVFEFPTLATLAKRINDADNRTSGEELPPLISVSRDEPIQLSFAQQRLWFLAHLEGRTATYNVAHALLLEGSIDVAALENSLDALISRHEVLRTNLVELDGWPYQIIRESHDFKIEMIALEEGDTELQIREAQRLADERAAMPFDLSEHFLLRASLLRLNSATSVLIVVMHHIIWDAWSAEIFNRELAELYQAFKTGEPHSLSPLQIQYADFAHWQRHALIPHIRKHHLPYWIEKLSGAPVLLNLRTDRPRPLLQSYEGAKEAFEIDDDLTREIHALAHSYGATPFMILLTAYAVVLYRHSAQDDMVIGSPAASRTRREIEPLIGFFVNMLGLRVDLANDPTLGELLLRVKRAAIEAYQHQDTPFDLIVEALQPGRNLAHNPIFQVSFALIEDVQSHADTSDFSVTAIEVPGARARFDMELAIEKTDSKMAAAFVYNRDLFDSATIIDMKDHFIGTLRAMATNADERLSELSLLNESEWQNFLRITKETRSLKSESSASASVERKGYVAPRNAVEETLAGIWAEVLRRPKIGIYDNFFELGGDSILSIQVISRAARAGLGLTTQQMFQHQTIAELATVAGSKTIEAEQGLIEGEIPFTPIQRWFFENSSDVRLHFNQSLMLETPQDLQIDLFQKAINLLLLHHDMLRARVERDQTVWTQKTTGETDPVQIDYIDLYDFPDDLRASVIETTADRLQASLDITRSPLIRVAYFDFGQGQSGRLLLIVHHFVIDGVSWRIVVEDLITLYGQLLRGDAPSLPPKTTSFREWSLLIQSLAKSPEVAEESHYWTEPSRSRAKSLPLDYPFDEDSNTVGDAESYKLSLSALDTRILLEGAARYYGLQANEVIITALVSALKSWTGEETVLIDLEGHGREDLFESVDMSHTVGWFTTIFPVIFDTSAKVSASDLPGMVKEQMRAIPRRGIGYGLLRYCSDRPDIQSRLCGLPQAEIVFNYLGQTDQTLASHSEFRLAVESTGADQSLQRKRTHIIEISAIVTGGELRLDFVYSRKLHRRETIEGFAESFRVELDSLIARCSPLPAAVFEEIFKPERDAVTDVYPLSPLQSGMLFRSLLEPESNAYFEQLSCEVEGALDVELFNRAWKSVIERHEVLRTGLLWEGLDRPLQVVFRSVELPWEFYDWTGIDRSEPGKRLEEFLEEDRNRKFDLRRAPAFRLTLIRLAPDRYIFCWSHHHILLDGWSVSNILKEVISFYLSEGRAVLREAKPFRSYIDWIEDQNKKEAEKFWRDHLHGFLSPTPLPVTGARSPANRYDKEEMRLSEEFTSWLRSIAQRQRITLNTLIRGVWAILLSRYSDQEDICFGVTLAGRPAALDGVEEMVGLFINTLPLRVKVSERETLSSWLQEIQPLHVELEKFSYSDLAEVQRWSEIAAGARLFDSILVFENYPVDQSLDQETEVLTFSPVGAFEQTEYPLTLAVVPDDELYVRMRYDTDRFDAETVHRMLSHLRAVLESFAANPDRAIEDIAILSESEISQLDKWSGKAVDVEMDTTIHEMFERQAQHAPAATALIYRDSVVTFGELNDRANRLANLLIERGVRADIPVALFFDRSIEMIIALFGILKAGGAYLPLNLSYPVERLRLMIDDSNACLVLTQQSLISKLPANNKPVICLDRDSEELARHNRVSPASGTDTSNLAYIIYTSGTSDRPKGVAITHRSVVNLLHGLNREVYRDNRGNRLRVGVNGPLAFDTSVKQIIQLLNGHALVIIPEEIRYDPAALIEFVRRHSIDVLDCTPSHLELLLEHGLPDGSNVDGLRKVLIGGEPISEEIWNWLADYNSIDFYNVYGPTETTVDATVAEITHSAIEPIIGHPISNVRVYVVDRKLRRVPVGVKGELLVGGAGVARGYLNDPALSAISFAPDPFDEAPDAKVYKTGDLARWRSDGNLEFIGRRDEQVKIRGHRIELREIEMLLEQHSDVRQAVAISQKDMASNHQLVAYIVRRSDGNIDLNELREFLKSHLPAYMIPAALVEIERVPLTANGKVDKRGLPSSDEILKPARGCYIPPRDAIERRLVDIWQQTLGVNEIGVRDNFFEAGGHSILAMKLVGRIQAEMESHISIAHLFEYPTIERLADALRDTRTSIEWQSLIRLHAGGKGRPIFLLPGAGGNVLYYYQLAKHLGQNRPVYGLQSVGLDGATPPLTTIEEIARHNIDRIRETQMHGPYLIAGHSFGGKVAFEMGQQLRDADQEVGLVALFDTPAPVFQRIADRQNWDDARWLVQIVREIEEFLRIDLNTPYDELHLLSDDERLKYVIERIERSGWWIPGGDSLQLRGHLQVYKTNYQIDYVIREAFHRVPIMLFKASDEAEPKDHPSLGALRREAAWGWDRFSSHPVEVIDVSGDHLTMMSNSSAEKIAERLSAFLEKFR